LISTSRVSDLIQERKMDKIIACIALLLCAACASDQAARRPAATPTTEPAPGNVHGAHPDTMTTPVPPETAPTESEPIDHPSVHNGE
jgi:hypothetical protein